MESCTCVAQGIHVGTGGVQSAIEKILLCTAIRYTGHYAVQGSTVFSPAASNGAVSRVATIMALAAAVAAM